MQCAPPARRPTRRRSRRNRRRKPSFSLYGPQPEIERAWLEIDALLLHLRAGSLKDVGRQLFAPVSGDVGKVLKKDRGDLDIFLARGTIEEGRDLSDVLLGH